MNWGTQFNCNDTDFAPFEQVTALDLGGPYHFIHVALIYFSRNLCKYMQAPEQASDPGLSLIFSSNS